MDLRESIDERRFREEVRQFVARELPADIRERVFNFQRVEREDYVRWQRILHARGWGAPAWPREHGGTGWSPVQRVIFEDECFSGGAPRQIPFGLSMCGPVLMKFGTDEQKARFLPHILTLGHWWCQGYSEPGAGSDLASLKTRAQRRGDIYVVDGQKIWTTFAHWADWIFCLVRTRQDGKPQEGISFLLIDMKSPGVTVRTIRTLDQGVDIAEVFFDQVQVPVAHRVGEENQGWTIAKYLLGHERATIAGIGMCKRLLRRLKSIASQQIRRGRPLLRDPRFRHRIVNLEIELLSHEWSLFRLVSREAAGQSVTTEASILKIRGSEIQQNLAELLMECAGLYALPYVPEALEADFAGDTPGGALLNGLAAQYFDMRKVSIYGGTSEIQKGIVAKATLGV
jgi:alkylation response protein AidB-like acyl-CoA dehydrogenase